MCRYPVSTGWIVSRIRFRIHAPSVVSLFKATHKHKSIRRPLRGCQRHCSTFERREYSCRRGRQAYAKCTDLELRRGMATRKPKLSCGIVSNLSIRIPDLFRRYQCNEQVCQQQQQLMYTPVVEDDGYKHRQRTRNFETNRSKGVDTWPHSCAAAPYTLILLRGVGQTLLRRGGEAAKRLGPNI